MRSWFQEDHFAEKSWKIYKYWEITRNHEKSREITRNFKQKVQRFRYFTFKRHYIAFFPALIDDDNCLRYYLHGRILREIKISVSLEEESYSTLTANIDFYAAIRFRSLINQDELSKFLKLLFGGNECFEIRDFIPDSVLLYSFTTSVSWSSDDELGLDPFPEPPEECIC